MGDVDTKDRPKGDGLPAQKVGFAAALGLLMVIVSSTTALYTGYLLWRGDPGSEVLNTLPASCEWVALVEDPTELRAAAADVSKWTALPEPLTGLLGVGAQALADDLTAAAGALDMDGPAGLCRWRTGLVLSAGLKSDAKDAVGTLQTVIAKRLQLASSGWTPGESAGGFVQYALADEAGAVRVALLQGPERVIVAWADAGTSATALLTAIVKKTQEAPMREDVAIRSAAERVGSGAVQFAANPVALKRWASTFLKGHYPAELLKEHSEYAGLSILRDKGETHLHLHIGATQKGVLWLKSAMDPIGAVPAAVHLDADATGGGVLRLNPEGLRRRGAWLGKHPWLGKVASALGTPSPDVAYEQLGSVMTGHVVWQMGGGPTPWRIAAQLRPQQDAAAKTLIDKQLPNSGLGFAVGGGWLVATPGDRSAAKSALSDLSKSAGLGDQLSVERTRMLKDNQGFYLDKSSHIAPYIHGPVQFEALWLQTGFVAHLTFPSPG
ncbi:MAG: hypothetical protein KC502_10230 [Myxococcales bacterium]|nr:hypothetical protein [Myxococcales bacterium]